MIRDGCSQNSGEDTDDTEDTEDTQDTEDTWDSDPVQGSLQGNTYLIDLSSADFIEPPGFGALFSGIIENYFLIELSLIIMDSFVQGERFLRPAVILRICVSSQTKDFQQLIFPIQVFHFHHLTG